MAMDSKAVSVKEDRLSKLKQISSLGINPFPSKVKFDRQDISDAISKKGKEVAIAGRILGWRGHGNVVFADVADSTGKMQAFFQKKIVGEDFKLLKLIDVGDFIAVKGKVIKTVAGEISVDVSDYQLLTKSIRPLPSTWFGPSPHS